MIGVRYFPIRNSRGVSLMLGLDPSGIKIFTNDNTYVHLIHISICFGSKLTGYHGQYISALKKNVSMCPIFHLSRKYLYVTLLAFVGICVFIITKLVPLSDGLLCFFVNRVLSERSVYWSNVSRRNVSSKLVMKCNCTTFLYIISNYRQIWLRS